MNQDQTEALGYQPPLDGIRAFAVVAVVLYHAVPRLASSGGYVGVDMFFVLSGFLITRILLAEERATGGISLRRFYIRRFLRLTPAFALLLLAQLVFDLMFLPGAVEPLKEWLYSALYLRNWALAFEWVRPGGLVHIWSLSAEEQFYLLWPGLLLLLRGRRGLAWVAAAIGVSAVWQAVCLLWSLPVGRVYWGFDTHPTPLLIGCALAFIPLTPRLRRIAARSALIPAALLVVSSGAIDVFSSFWTVVSFYTTGLCTAWLIVAVLHEGGWPRRMLSWAPAVYTGKISYGWYLWHYPVLIAGAQFLPHGPGIGLALAIGTYPVAAASYRWVEQPFMRLKHRFATNAGRAEQARPAFQGDMTGRIGPAGVT